jgi:hypothetical protein
MKCSSEHQGTLDSSQWLEKAQLRAEKDENDGSPKKKVPALGGRAQYDKYQHGRETKIGCEGQNYAEKVESDGTPEKKGPTLGGRAR